MLAALEEPHGAFLVLLFHPFLADTDERVQVIRDVLARVRALVDEGAVTLRALPRARLEPLAHEPRAVDQRAQLGERRVARQVLHPAVGADLQPLGAG